MSKRFVSALVIALVVSGSAVMVGIGPASALRPSPFCLHYLGKVPIPPPILGLRVRLHCKPKERR